MNGRGHVHNDHAHSHVSRSTQRRALWISLAANGVFMVVEVIGGIAFQSLALLADAAHMLSDVAALGIALIAQHLVDRRATARHSYGLQRAEVLGAQANGLARGGGMDHLRGHRTHRRTG
jgi:cobalt-zinc-cadmium efflux system protein